MLADQVSDVPILEKPPRILGLSTAHFFCQFDAASTFCKRQISVSIIVDIENLSRRAFGRLLLHLDL